MSNRLINETSPYLIQHANNPVNWYPWCNEAFIKAKNENKPIFLSIGYSTCHWCHVMAHESFENNTTAELLNKNFISIKVDREERPDIDSIYMSVCQAFTGSGGWPMSIFMTWDKKPFFAGTYFPVDSKHGMVGFNDLLNTISQEWNTNSSELLKSSDEIINHLKMSVDSKAYTDNTIITNKAIDIYKKLFDHKHGGFGKAPKFPAPHNLLFLMYYSVIFNENESLKISEKTLQQMRKGGLFDHIGYGFSRYSTDKMFLVPHFEKMLYDNALLIIAYTTAYAITNNNLYIDTAQKTAEYILRDMKSDNGGFYSAQDADINGIEGKYYTFTLNEIIDVLGEEKGRKFSEVFDITKNGNFEGVNIPNLLKSNAVNLNFNDEISKLYSYLKKRNSIHVDDKILVSWNSLMIVAFAILYRVTKNEYYLKTAQQCMNFIDTNLCTGYRLYTSYRNSKHSENSVLDDYAYYISALIELYNSTLNTSYLDKAELFLTETITNFYDFEKGGFYLCTRNSKEFFINPKETYDGAMPSGNSVMTYNLVRLYQLTEKEEYKQFCDKQIEYMNTQTYNYPTGHSMFLISKLLYENPPEHITVVIKNNADLSQLKKKLPVFSNISIISPNKDYPLLNEQTTYYICKNHSCLPPTNEI